MHNIFDERIFFLHLHETVLKSQSILQALDVMHACFCISFILHYEHHIVRTI